MPDDRKPKADVDTEMAGGLRMSRAQMLDLGQKALELLVERTESLPGENAWEGEFRQVLEDQLIEDPPEDGRPAAEVTERVAREILPYATRLDHPRCFGFVPSSPTWPGVVADFMASGYHINQCTWLVASGPSQLELVVIDWFRRWLGYPEGAGGLFTSGGSAASVDAFVAAREAAGHPERATVYMSDQSHSALSRAAMIVGVRRECIRMVPSDAHFRMDMEALATVVAADRDAGLSPIAIAANAGTTGTGAIDRLEEMADFCAAEGVWLHVDAAYGGFAVVTERGKRLLRGIERGRLHRARCTQVVLPALRGGLPAGEGTRTRSRTHSGSGPTSFRTRCGGTNHPNFSNLGLQLSRSVRALKVWMSVPDLRDGLRSGERWRRGMGAVRSGRGVRPCESGPGASEYAHAGDRVLPLQSGAERARTRRRSTRSTGAVLARMFWGRPGVHVVDAVARNVRAQNVHRPTTPPTWDDVREDPGGGRAVRARGRCPRAMRLLDGAVCRACVVRHSGSGAIRPAVALAVRARPRPCSTGNPAPRAPERMSSGRTRWGHRGPRTYGRLHRGLPGWQGTPGAGRRAVPAAVRHYRLGGYQVLKKWPSYREGDIIGGTLEPEALQYAAALP